jgi:hypothetical protein
MTDPDQKQLIADVARDIVMQTAPEELPLFRATSAAYFKNPDKVLKGQTSKDEILGFGAGEAVVMLTPYVLVIVTEVVRFVIAQVQQSVAAESADLISDIVKKLFKRVRPEENNLLPLTPAQLAQVRKVAYESACRLNLPDNQASLLADAIKGSMLS